MKIILKLLSVGLVWLTLMTLMSPFQLPITILGRLFKNKRIRKKKELTYGEYNYNFWISQDQFVNTIHGGKPDITISSRVGYWARRENKTAIGMSYFIDFLFFVAVGQKGHCEASIEHDEEHKSAW